MTYNNYCSHRSFPWKNAGEMWVDGHIQKERMEAMEERKEKLVIEKNAVYELDLECLRRKKKEKGQVEQGQRNKTCKG